MVPQAATSAALVLQGHSSPVLVRMLKISVLHAHVAPISRLRVPQHCHSASRVPLVPFRIGPPLPPFRTAFRVPQAHPRPPPVQSVSSTALPAGQASTRLPATPSALRVQLALGAAALEFLDRRSALPAHRAPLATRQGSHRTSSVSSAPQAPFALNLAGLGSLHARVALLASCPWHLAPHSAPAARAPINLLRTPLFANLAQAPSS